MLETIIAFVADDQSKWSQLVHEGEAAVWLGLTYRHLVPGFGN
jgi:hypothetical protein